jgi:hypothetical protein
MHYRASEALLVPDIYIQLNDTRAIHARKYGVPQAKLAPF